MGHDCFLLLQEKETSRPHVGFSEVRVQDENIYVVKSILVGKTIIHCNSVTGDRLSLCVCVGSPGKTPALLSECVVVWWLQTGSSSRSSI